MNIKKSLFGKRRANRHNRRQYHANIVYSYSVGDVMHTSGRHHVGWHGLTGSPSGSKKYLEGVLQLPDKYRPGNSITVHYNPDKPNAAVVRKGYTGYLPVQLLWGFGLICAGAFKSFRS